jgi:asparagine synthase (glutamine-hydrolysing)
MCGIAGILNLTEDQPVTERDLRQMLALIRHRGPDQFGIFLDDGAGLGSARLSIIDIGHGQQPISNEDGTLWIVFNGEIFNYPELRPELEARGHRFETETDTEVLLHMFEEYGPDCLSRLNGQFAFAIWNTCDRSLFLARDRLGIRPLYYTIQNGSLVFGSEIKAILGSGRASASLDPAGIDQVFNYWSTLSPGTVFRNIAELPPGHWLRVNGDGLLEMSRFWQMPLPEISETEANPDEGVIEERTEQLRELLADSVRIRLRADVPVAAYLSGGLDSAVIGSLACKVAPTRLNTFSISFSDPAFDESEFQRSMADHLGTRHEVVYAHHADIGRVFPEVIWHCETPILRTSPGPMFLLSALLQKRGYKVALTGEGADEMLGGYDIFKEAKIRRFWAAQPQSHRRALLLKRLYPDIAGFNQTGGFLAAFFGEGLTDVDSPFYSHSIRWRNGARHRRFYSPELVASLGAGARDAGADIKLPDGFMGCGPLERAQYLEAATFLSSYLLSSQGDRVGMAHGVEGRLPFLDFRVVEFCAQLPARLKLRVLNEKFLLRRVAAPMLPPNIASRRKRPYRAPIHGAFFNDRTEEYVRELLSPEALRSAGLFQPRAVSQLVAKLQAGAPVGEMDDMALAGILSSQLVHQQFVTDFRMPAPLSERDDVKVCRARKTAHAVSYALS